MTRIIAGNLNAPISVEPDDGRSSLQVPQSWKIPLRFAVRKTDGDRRTLALPHPYTQLTVVDFYRKYADLMVDMTSRSNFSLRHPTRVARYTFVEDVEHSEIATNRRRGIETTSLEAEYQLSYFVYRSYSNINKFYESQEFHALEAKFALHRRLDVTRCFESLYTHTIDWAIRGHHASKHGIQEKLYSVEWDRIFQSANHGQTNGILVGPEFSRLFAETILQRVDLEVERGLKLKEFEAGRDYWIGRYVDDYFLFAHDRATLSVIQEMIEDGLEKYNLRLNKSKQLDFDGPAASPIHTAKQRLSRRMDVFFTDASTSLDSDGLRARLPSMRLVISEYKAILSDLSVRPAEVNNYLLGVLERRLRKLLARPAVESRAQKEALIRVSDDAIQLVEYLYAACPTVSAALRATRILLHTLQSARSKRGGPDLIAAVEGSINGVCRRAMLRAADKASSIDGAEKFYWLLLQAELGRRYLLDARLLVRVLDSGAQGGWGYLAIVCMLRYVQNRDRYSHVRDLIAERVEHLLETSHPSSAELAFLRIDMIACPFVTDDKKLAWLKRWFSSWTERECQAALASWPASVFASWNDFDLEAALRAKRRQEVY